MIFPFFPTENIKNYGHSRLKKMPERFRLCIWNWQKNKHKNWPTEFDRLVKNADLFLVQEASLSPRLKEKWEHSKLFWTQSTAFLSPIKKYPTGVATASVCQPIQTHFCTTETEPFIQTAKTALATLLPVQHNKFLWVINIHAVNFRRIRAFQSALMHLSKMIPDDNTPVLLGGDFNTWSKARTDLLYGLAKQKNLREVVFKDDYRKCWLGKPLDFLFIRGLKVHSAHIYKTDSSDHNPLLAELSVQ